MRRIFTSFSIFCLVAVSQLANAQTCSESTTAPGGYTANTTIANTGSASFTWASGASTPAPVPGTFQANNTSVTSPVMYGATSSVTFSYDLTSTAPAAGTTTVSSYTITLLYGNPTQTVTCTGTGFTVANTTTTYYFTISGITFPVNRNFQARLTLVLPNGAKDITTANFTSSGILSPAGSALPVKISTFEARSVNSSTSLTWNVAAEDNVSGYDVEKSLDGRSFSKIAFVPATGASSYTYVDAKPLEATTYYRVKSVDADGKFSYSTIASLRKGGKSTIVLRAFPMPAIKDITIQHATATRGSLLSISSEDGRVIKSVVPASGTQQTVIDLSSAKAGLYIIRYSNANGEVESLKLIKQ